MACRVQTTPRPGRSSLKCLERRVIAEVWPRPAAVLSVLATLIALAAVFGAGTPSADASVLRAIEAKSSPPDGVANRIRVRSAPNTEARLRFRVPADARGSTQASLAIYVLSANRATLDVFASAGRGPARRIATESGIMGRRWIEVDVTKAMRGSEVRLTLRARGTKPIDFSDRRGGKNGPRLALRGGPGEAAEAAERITRADRMGLSGGGNFQFAQEGDLTAWLDGAQAAGVQWLRFDLSWFDVQNEGPESWNWTRYDRVIQDARSRGMKVLPTLGHTPPWARAAGTDDRHPPDDPRAFARFAAEAVRRYAPLGVSHWMIWNEPNIGAFWAPRPEPERYVDLLVAAAREIRTADENARVILGGLAPATDGPQSLSPVSFLKLVYRAGGRVAFDAVAAHPYSFPVRPSHPAPWNAWQQVANTNPSIRSVMIANGDADKLVWMTEFGAPTGGPVGERVTRAQQAAILVEGYAINRKAPWAGPLFWHTYSDTVINNGSREPFFGLVTADLRPKPALAAYRRVARSSR